MDLQWAVVKLGDLWKKTGNLNLGQVILLALFIYMLPSIIRVIFEVISSMIRSIVRMMVFTLLVGIAINLYLGNSSDTAEMLNHIQKFGKKAIKSFFLQD